MSKVIGKVKIIWNGMGGELDSVICNDDGEQAIADALVKMLENNIVSPGDSFVVQAAE